MAVATAKNVQFADDLDALMAQDSALPSVPSTTLKPEVFLTACESFSRSAAI